MENGLKSVKINAPDAKIDDLASLTTKEKP